LQVSGMANVPGERYTTLDANLWTGSYSSQVGQITIDLAAHTIRAGEYYDGNAAMVKPADDKAYAMNTDGVLAVFAAMKFDTTD